MSDYYLSAKRLSQLVMIDRMPPQLRECVHEYGLAIVTALYENGVKEPRRIRQVVREIWSGARQAGQNSGAMNTLDFILAQGPVSAKTLKRVLADNNMVISPVEPTRAMLEASMAEVSGFNERMTKREKHRRRLVAALAAIRKETE